MGNRDCLFRGDLYNCPRSGSNQLGVSHMVTGRALLSEADLENCCLSPSEHLRDAGPEQVHCHISVYESGSHLG